MPNPKDSHAAPSHRPAAHSKTAKGGKAESKPAAAAWVRPERPPLKSAMLSNQRLNLNKSPRANNSRKP